MLEFECPHCNAILSIPEQFVGATGTCRKCKKSITIEVKPEPNGRDTSRLDTPLGRPTLVAFHIETTGPASRKHAIIEIGAIKVDLSGKTLDTFWSFCNPDSPIPDSIIERTGVTNDMVAASAFPFEVIREWFEWLGPNAILFSDHAHFHAKFVSASLLKEDIVPPEARIIDVVHWAEDKELRVPEFKLRPILEALGHPLKPLHRAMDEAEGVAHLLTHLLRAHDETPAHDEHGMFGKLLGKKHTADTSAHQFELLDAMAATLADSCGPNFHELERFDERSRLREQAGKKNNGSRKSSVRLHLPEWYEERERLLESHQGGDSTDESPPLTQEDMHWTQALMEASQAPTSEDQRRHLLEAVSLGARDPWPYERLTGFYIRAKDYKSAQKVCERYFESDSWKIPQYVDSSIKLLHKMEKLERRLAQVS